MTVSSTDYSGVATADLARIVGQYLVDSGESFEAFSTRVPGVDGKPMNARDLKGTLITQNYSFTGLRVADNILSACGLNLSQLAETGELPVVPARRSEIAARKMVADTYFAKMSVQFAGLTDEQLDAKIEARMKREPRKVSKLVEELLSLRDERVVSTEEQRGRLKADAARAARRASS